jgi:hypothetical protein
MGIGCALPVTLPWGHRGRLWSSTAAGPGFDPSLGGETPLQGELSMAPKIAAGWAKIAEARRQRLAKWRTE